MAAHSMRSSSRSIFEVAGVSYHAAKINGAAGRHPAPTRTRSGSISQSLVHALGQRTNAIVLPAKCEKTFDSFTHSHLGEDMLLPDVVAPNLRLVFVGTAAGRRSAALGQYYAGRGNAFWPTLHKVGLTPRELAPVEFMALLDLGIGLTDMSKRGVGMDRDISAGLFDRHRLAQIVQQLRPGAIAFTSKKAASIWFERGTQSISHGRQGAAAGLPMIFVLPSPSGAARAYWDIHQWKQLADHVKEL